MDFSLRGVGVAMVTPFKPDKSIDFNAINLLIEHIIGGGVDYIVSLGTTAETPTLFPDERMAVLEHVKKCVGGRVPVVAGIGGNNTANVMKAIGDCDLSGVAAVLSVTPFYNRPSQRGLYEHYKAIAEVSPLPVILYNVPSRTGVNMLPETTLRLAHDFENIVAIKEAAGKVEQFEELIAGRPAGFGIVSGDDNMALPLIERGGDGLISVAANAFPAQYSRMITSALNGNMAEAHSRWEPLEQITRALFDEGNPTGIKAALAVKGIIGNTLRLPLVESSPELYAKIEGLIRKEGL